MRVTDCISSHVYRVFDLNSEKSFERHASFLRFFHDSSLPINADVTAHAAYTRNANTVAKFVDFRQNSAGVPQLKVLWRGFPETDFTWEPLANMIDDVPVLVERFVSSLNRPALTAAYASLCPPAVSSPGECARDARLLNSSSSS